MANWCLDYRSRTGTQVSPFQLLFGFQPKAPADGSTQPSSGKSFEGLQFTKKNLSDAELVKQLDIHRKCCMEVIERATKRTIEATLFANDQASYEVRYNISDLVLLPRPKIGLRAHGTATRLMYQNVGPFEVVEKLSDVTYTFAS